MDWNLFWTAFGAIGGTVGAFATLAAVVVALWQTKVSYKKELKVSFTDDIAVVPDNGKHISRFVGVTVTNIGNRDVVIQGWGFICHDKTRMMIVPDTSPIGRMIQTTLPKKLQIEESISLYYNKNLFHSVLEENIKTGALQRNRKVHFYVIDSTSKTYYTLTSKTVNEMLYASGTKKE